MNVTSNSTITNTYGLSNGVTFAIVFFSTSVWFGFIFCLVCTIEYSKYKENGGQITSESRRNRTMSDGKAESQKKVQNSTDAKTLPSTQEMSTFSHDDEITDSSFDGKDNKLDKFDTFHSPNQLQENGGTIDFPTPKNRKTILPPVNVGTIINVETKCHSDTNSPLKETLLEPSVTKSKQTQITSVIVHS